MTGPGEQASDEELVLAASRGESRAFEQLLGRHESRVLRVLRLMGVPIQDREDVAQEVFVRIFRHLDGFRRGRPFGSWVYGICVNAAHDYRSRRSRLAGESGWEEDLDPAQVGGGPQEAAERRDLRLELERALTTLSDRERAVFVLRELEGLDTRTVARTLGISGVTVRRHLGRARKRLQEALAGRR